MTEAQKIEQRILTLLAENNQRMNDALLDPTYTSNPSKLTILINQNMATLAEVARLQQEKIFHLMAEHAQQR